MSRDGTEVHWSLKSLLKDNPAAFWGLACTLLCALIVAATTIIVTWIQYIGQKQSLGPKPLLPSISVDYPKSGQKVPMQGVRISGSAKNLQGGKIWIFDYSDGIYVKDNDQGILPNLEGRWNFLDAPIGDESGQAMEIVIIYANERCISEIRRARAGRDGTVAFKDRLPEDCQEAVRLAVVTG